MNSLVKRVMMKNHGKVFQQCAVWWRFSSVWIGPSVVSPMLTDILKPSQFCHVLSPTLTSQSRYQL